jgi:hypothetical protein
MFFWCESLHKCVKQFLKIVEPLKLLKFENFLPHFHFSFNLVVVLFVVFNVYIGF